MTYDNPYRDAELVEYSDNGGGIYYAFNENEEHAKVMSEAAHSAVEQVIKAWFSRPGAIACKLDIEDRAINVYVEGPDGGDHLAEFSLSLAELVLSAANTSNDYVGLPPSTVSNLLRELADQIEEA